MTSFKTPLQLVIEAQQRSLEVNPLTPKCVAQPKEKPTMPLYDIAVMQLPTRAEADAGVQPKLILGPKTYSAPDPATAQFLAGSDLTLPEGVSKDLIQMKCRVWA